MAAGKKRTEIMIGLSHSAPTTRERLKSAARQLFALHGFDGVSVRDILREAGDKNGASISYYFGTKDDLIREITADTFCASDAFWAAGLKELEDRIASPSLRDYIRVIIEAHTKFASESDYSWRISLHLTYQRHNVIASIMKQHKLVSYDRVLERIARHLPDIPPPILRQRLIGLTRYLSSMVALYEATRTQASGLTVDLGNILDTTVGLVSAPIVDANKL